MTSLLVLIPTPLERDYLEPRIRESVQGRGGAIELCGFGVLAAAALTSRLLATHQPEQVCLLGIAGTYVEGLRVGSAHEFGEVSCYGIGVGSGKQFRSATRLGWHPIPEQPDVGESLRLGDASHRLLTCCAASHNRQDKLDRLASYPEAEAEDMEGFGVALACQLAGIPCRIIRGISNCVGDRDHQSWKIHDALEAVADRFLADASS